MCRDHQSWGYRIPEKCWTLTPTYCTAGDFLFFPQRLKDDALKTCCPLCPFPVTRKDRQQFGDFSLRYGNGTDTVIRMLHMELFKLLLFSLLLAVIIPEDFFQVIKMTFLICRIKKRQYEEYIFVNKLLPFKPVILVSALGILIED